VESAADRDSLGFRPAHQSFSLASTGAAFHLAREQDYFRDASGDVCRPDFPHDAIGTSARCMGGALLGVDLVSVPVALSSLGAVPEVLYA
jgi:hypothetical protein